MNKILIINLMLFFNLIYCNNIRIRFNNETKFNIDYNILSNERVLISQINADSKELIKYNLNEKSIITFSINKYIIGKYYLEKAENVQFNFEVKMINENNCIIKTNKDNAENEITLKIVNDTDSSFDYSAFIDFTQKKFTDVIPPKNVKEVTFSFIKVENSNPQFVLFNKDKSVIDFSQHISLNYNSNKTIYIKTFCKKTFEVSSHPLKVKYLKQFKPKLPTIAESDEEEKTDR